MSRLNILFLFVAVFFFGNHSAFATTYAVGTCEPHLTSYSTISQAVGIVPPGSIVDVCPGIYTEQITIAKPLTLQGVTIGNANAAVINVPSGGLAVNISPFAAHILVTSGPVNITNITVDSTGNGLGTGTELAGIYYSAGSSGIVKDVTARHQTDSGRGIGIFADNTNGTNELLTIENCSIHDFDSEGIAVTGKYTATIKANNIDASNVTAEVFGISSFSAGSVTANVLTGPGTLAFDTQGITMADSASATVTGNTVVSFYYGLADTSGASYTSNTVRNSAIGIALTTGAKAESNTITWSAFYGIAINCDSATVKSNTIIDAPIALFNVPSGLSSTNTYFNVPTIRTNCTGAADAPPDAAATSRDGALRDGPIPPTRPTLD
jgi:hypothetical protein